MNAALSDMQGKQEAMNNLIGAKQEEINELAELKKQFSVAGEKLEEEVSVMKEEQASLIEQFEQQKEDMFQKREQREEAESKLKELTDNNRQLNEEIFKKNQTLNKLYGLLQKQRDEISEACRDMEIKENQLNRKSVELEQLSHQKNDLEKEVESRMVEVQMFKKQRLIDQEYLRSTGHQNLLLHHRIEAQQEQTRRLIEAYD